MSSCLSHQMNKDFNFTHVKQTNKVKSRSQMKFYQWAVTSCLLVLLSPSDRGDVRCHLICSLKVNIITSSRALGPSVHQVSHLQLLEHVSDVLGV